jgi:hypothetical protein
MWVSMNVFEMSDSFARTLSVLSRARRLCGVWEQQLTLKMPCLLRH